MNVIKTRSRWLSVISAAVLLAGAGIIGMTSGAGAADKASGAAPPAVAAAAQPIALAAEVSVAGGWTLTTDWGCDGSITGSFTVTFNANGTWTSSGGNNGRWYQVGSMVVWNFANVANLIYSGNLSGSWMSGVQGYPTAGGSTGCFGGHLSSVAAQARVPATAGQGDPITGR